MRIDAIFRLVLPLLGLIAVAAMGKLLPGGGTSRKSLVAGIAIAATVMAVYVYARYVIFPPALSS